MTTTDVASMSEANYLKLIEETSKMMNSMMASVNPDMFKRSAAEEKAHEEHLETVARCMAHVGWTSDADGGGQAPTSGVVSSIPPSSPSAIQINIIKPDVPPEITTPSRPVCPSYKRLTEEEFMAVGSYVRNRMTLANLNGAVDTLNEMLHAKYTLLKQKMAAVSKDDRQKILDYRAQDCKDTKGMFFLVEKDVKKALSSPALVVMFGKSVVPTLRHCKRIREVRGGGLLRICVAVNA